MPILAVSAEEVLVPTGERIMTYCEILATAAENLQDIKLGICNLLDSAAPKVVSCLPSEVWEIIPKVLLYSISYSSHNL